MRYSLLHVTDDSTPKNSLKAWATMWPLLRTEIKGLSIAFTAVILNAVFTLLGPLIIGRAIDTYVPSKDYHGILISSLLLLLVSGLAFLSSYIQMRSMGAVAQRTLWRLRTDVFAKLQSLPLAFFNQNKSGDLISRINNDTDKLNQFFSEGLMRFAGNIFVIIGAALFILSLDWRVGGSALIPGVVIFLFTIAIRPWASRRNAESLKATGQLSAEIQESMANFKVILAFNRRDYFRDRFATVTERSFKTAFGAGIANELYLPVFEFAGNIAQLVLLAVGFYFISHGSFALGLLVSFVIYINRFYDPLREMARLWSTFQVAIAAWDRIGVLLAMTTDLETISPDKAHTKGASDAVVEFSHVTFTYEDETGKGKTVLHDVSFAFEKGKTYALVGPTGGGKTTTASLIARLYDPSSGAVYLGGADIRTYTPAERARRIGFILQDAFLFTGTIGENLSYGNEELAGLSNDEIAQKLSDMGLGELISRFDKGLDTVVSGSGSLSLGERQIVAFARAVLRRPQILILDEATANIDTVTEKVLERILDQLPAETTKVVIAHRLNTIANADDIFFVNAGTLVEAGSMEHAVDMLLHGKRQS